MASIRIEPLHLALQESFQPGLPNSGEHDRSTIGRAVPVHGEYDLVSQIAAERFQLANNFLELRSLPVLLFLPPAAQRRALLQPVLEKLAGFGQSGRQIGNRGIDCRVIWNVGQQVGAVTQPRSRNRLKLLLQDRKVSQQGEVFCGIAAPRNLVFDGYLGDAGTGSLLIAGAQLAGPFS